MSQSAKSISRVHTRNEHESVFCAEHRHELNNSHSVHYSSYPDTHIHLTSENEEIKI